MKELINILNKTNYTDSKQYNFEMQIIDGFKFYKKCNTCYISFTTLKNAMQLSMRPEVFYTIFGEKIKEVRLNGVEVDCIDVEQIKKLALHHRIMNNSDFKKGVKKILSAIHLGISK